MAGNARKAVLKNMRVSEISLVPEGDNPGADVLILKTRDRVGTDIGVVKQRLTEATELAAHLGDLSAGAEGAEGVEKAAAVLKGLDMDINELNERLGQIETSLDTVTKEKDELAGKVTALTADLDKVTKERDAAITERDAAVEKAKGAKTEESDEDVLKTLSEPVRKIVEDARAEAKEAKEAVEKARDERDLEVHVEKVKALGLPDADKVGATLHRIAKGKSTPEDATVIDELLTKAKAQADGGKALFERIGKAQGGDGQATEAEAKLETAIEAIQKAKPALTREQAYTEALDANPSLYDEIQKAKASA
jgi:hypothetical protein